MDQENIDKLNYNYKEFKKAGLGTTDADGSITWAPDEATCDTWLSAWDGKADKIAEVKAEARKRINGVTKEVQQANKLARMVQLEISRFWPRLKRQ